MAALWGVYGLADTDASIVLYAVIGMTSSAVILARAGLGRVRRSVERAKVDGVDREDVMRWVSAYARVWRDEDAGAVVELFSEDAAYRALTVRGPGGRA